MTRRDYKRGRRNNDPAVEPELQIVKRAVDQAALNVRNEKSRRRDSPGWKTAPMPPITAACGGKMGEFPFGKNLPDLHLAGFISLFI